MRVGVGLLYEFKFTESTVPERMELLRLTNRVGCVQVDGAERNDPRGMSLGRFGDYHTAAIGGEHACRYIQRLCNLHQIVDEVRFLFVKVNVHINNPVRRLVGRSR